MHKVGESLFSPVLNQMQSCQTYMFEIFFQNLSVTKKLWEKISIKFYNSYYSRKCQTFALT